MKLLTKLSKAALLLLACALVSCSEPTSTDTKNDERTPAAPTEPETPTPPKDEDKEETKYSIEITAKPTKTTYKVGETFDANGLTINYITEVTTNGKPNAEKSAKISVKYGESGLTAETDRELTEPGEVTLTVNVAYKNATATFTLEVAVEENKPTLFGIVIENNTLTIRDIETLKNFKLLEGEKCPDGLKVHIEIENNGETPPVVNLVDISKLHTISPDAKITASDNIEYTINGGTKRGTEGYFTNTILNNQFKDLTDFEIDGKIAISVADDDNTIQGEKATKLRTITVKGDTKLNITGKYLDIGRNRFVTCHSSATTRESVGNDNITLPSDVEITTYNSEVSDGSITLSDDIEITTDNNSNKVAITSAIAIEQYKQLGLTTPKFDLTISDENAYNFAKNILENYSYDQLNSDGHKLSISKYVDGKKALYTGNDLNDNVPSLKYDTLDFITPSEVKNLKITGTPSVKDKISASGIFTNVVFTGDMSSITNGSVLNGVIEFKDNPMKDILLDNSVNTLIRVNKIDTPIGTIRARILDFRGLQDYDTLISNVKVGGTGDLTGYFKDTKQKEALKDKIIDIDGGYHLNDFNPAYSEDVESERVLMRTLQEIAEEANAAL